MKDILANRMKCYEVLQKGKIAMSIQEGNELTVIYHYEGKAYRAFAVEGEIISFTEV